MKPDLDAIRARWPQGRLANSDAREDVSALLAYIDELERQRNVERERADDLMSRLICHEDAQDDICEDITHLRRVNASLEHMVGEERENVDALRARVAELEAEVAILRPWSVMLKRAHGALTDAGCVVPLEFDQSIEHAINDLARRATRAEQLFVDEYDARRDVERQRDELQARIAVLEAMKP